MHFSWNWHTCCIITLWRAFVSWRAGTVNSYSVGQKNFRKFSRIWATGKSCAGNFHAILSSTLFAGRQQFVIISRYTVSWAILIKGFLICESWLYGLHSQKINSSLHCISSSNSAIQLYKDSSKLTEMKIGSCSLNWLGHGCNNPNRYMSHK